TSSTALGQPPARKDAAGDPLPPGAVLRIGTVRWRTSASSLKLRSALSPDGRVLFVDDVGGGIQVIELDTGLSRRRFSENANSVWTMAISGDGRRLVSAGYVQGDKYSTIIWDVASGKQIRSFEIGADEVDIAALSHDGNKLVTGGRRNAPKLR